MNRRLKMPMGLWASFFAVGVSGDTPLPRGSGRRLWREIDPSRGDLIYTPSCPYAGEDSEIEHAKVCAEGVALVLVLMMSDHPPTPPPTGPSQALCMTRKRAIRVKSSNREIPRGKRNV